MIPVRTVAPAEAPVSLATAKSQLRIDGSDEDTIVQGMLDAAVAYLDGYAGILGRCMVTQTWELTIDTWPSNGIIPLPFPDVSTVAIAYEDANGDTQTLASSAYYLSPTHRGVNVMQMPGAEWPETEPQGVQSVTITFTAGYGGASAVPAPIKQAVIMLTGNLYKNRESTLQSGDVDNPTVMRLLAPYRRY
jgi:uncharacterized phiE125 gp8 family phage protein